MGWSGAPGGAWGTPLNLGVGCAPSCWPICGFRPSWVLAGGAEGSLLCSLSSRFSGGGGGVGSPPGRGGELGCQARVEKYSCVAELRKAPDARYHSEVQGDARCTARCTA